MSVPQTPRWRPPAAGDCAVQPLTGTRRAALLGTCARAAPLGAIRPRKKAKPEEMRGGTFTITNPGPIGGTAFTPIINYPKVAILGLARARIEPVVEGDLDNFTIVPRLCLPLHLAFDHRVNDGADAARFLRTIIDILSDPESFLLNV